MKFTKSEIKPWIILGFHLIRFGMLQNSELSKYQSAFIKSKNEVIAKTDPKAITSTEDYKVLFNGILDFYEKDEDVFSCICLGMAIIRCSKIAAGSTVVDNEAVKQDTLRVLDLTYLSNEEKKNAFSVIWSHWIAERSRSKYVTMTILDVVSEDWDLYLDFFAYAFYKKLTKKE